jgi:hypothetical protein
VEDLEDARVAHGRAQGGEVPDDQRVHQDGVAPVGRDLEEADLLEVVVEAVRLGVEADDATALEGAGEVGQPIRGARPRGGHGGEYTPGLAGGWK